jgi:hypothetical protein
MYRGAEGPKGQTHDSTVRECESRRWPKCVKKNEAKTGRWMEAACTHIDTQGTEAERAVSLMTRIQPRENKRDTEQVGETEPPQQTVYKSGTC